jgi:signal transduction histidine kinase/phage shock protein PspC (stress-responsive transcriptional regulator)
VLAGVAGGLGARFGIDPTIVRVVFVIASLAGGSGIVAYAVLWVVLPVQGGGDAVMHNALGDRRTVSEAVAVGLLVLVGMFLLNRLGLGFVSGLAWPLSIAAAAMVLVWRAAGEEDRAILSRLAAQLRGSPEKPAGRRNHRILVLRVVVGVVLILIGATSLLSFNRSIVALRDGVIATVGVVAGVGLIFGPWWLGLARDLAEERRQRIRSEERAEMATRIHDSVLQTLALIERQAGDPRAVVGLARRQERELRDWLYSTPAAATDSSFRAAVDRAARDVEETHGVTVDAVIVGDAPLDDPLEATAAAAKEAMVNAAKWSGTTAVSLYAEVEPSRVSVFVRDRGVGFDPTRVAGDHYGISQSIRARMQRHGGVAVLRSEPGRGTEVELVMERAA